MKIALINPPRKERRLYFLSQQMPLNIAYLASYLRQYDFEVEIWDYEVENFNPSNFVERVKYFNPTIIGLSCLTSKIIIGHRLASLVKKHLPKVMIIIGGNHVSSIPKETLMDFPNFDIAVIGEGEITLLELCQRIKEKKTIKGIPGIGYRNGNNIIIEKSRPLIKDINTIPFPARDLLKYNLYKGTVHKGFSRNYLKLIEIFTSRGCPFHCIFCASSSTMGNKIRFRNIDNVIAEIENCRKKYNINHVTILDDTFTFDQKRVKDLCKYFKKRNLTWNTTGTRVDTVNEDLLSEMAKSGCIGLAFGIESGSDHILKLINKKITIQQIKNAFRWARKYKIKYIEADFIVGAHPDETKKDLKLTKRLIKELKPDILSISYIVPFPGTKIYNLMKEREYLSFPLNWSDFVFFGNKLPSWKTKHFSSLDLLYLQRKLLTDYYFTPPGVLRKLKKINSFHEFIYWFKSAISFWLNKFRI
jgi:radical SAM superfamily enzyme YgiQ (UPF0313 family)